MKKTALALMPVLLCLGWVPQAFAQPSARARAMLPAPAVIHYKTETIDGVKVFYREAGPADGPVILLLHGFPTSSHMFRSLIPYLADKYRVIAPDYPGYGESDAPDTPSSTIRSRTMPTSSTRSCSDWARSATRCTSWIMARRSGTGWRSSIPSGSAG